MHAYVMHAREEDCVKKAVTLILSLNFSFARNVQSTLSMLIRNSNN